METSKVQSFKSPLVGEIFCYQNEKIKILCFAKNSYNHQNFLKNMKIISWNVNGIRAVERKGAIQDLIEKYHPDLLFLQEIKGTPDKFSAYLNAPEGYEAFYNPAEKAGYAGTGVWIKNEIRKYVDSVQTWFEGDPTANEGRVSHVILAKNDKIFDIFGIYFPNGGKSSEAWDGKLIFYANFSKKMDALRDAGHFVLWGGDINCAHNEIDLSRPKENDGKIGFHPAERAWLDDRAANDWKDIWRVQNPTTEMYSWWDQKTKARERNIGWRIDAFWGESQIFAATKNIEYLTEHLGSDHCPMLIEVEF